MFDDWRPTVDASMEELHAEIGTLCKQEGAHQEDVQGDDGVAQVHQSCGAQCRTGYARRDPHATGGDRGHIVR